MARCFDSAAEGGADEGAAGGIVATYAGHQAPVTCLEVVSPQWATVTKDGGPVVRKGAPFKVVTGSADQSLRLFDGWVSARDVIQSVVVKRVQALTKLYVKIDGMLSLHLVGLQTGKLEVRCTVGEGVRCLDVNWGRAYIGTEAGSGTSWNFKVRRNFKTRFS